MFKVLIQRYRNLIILIWCFGVLIFYKIAIDFEFQEGSSLLFLIILFSVPAGLQVNYYARKVELRRLKKAHQKTYFGQIQYDFITGMIDTKLIYLLNNLAKDTIINRSEDNIVLRCGSSTQVIITFNGLLCKIELENTKIVYNLYYDRVVFDTTQYDQKGFKYFGPERLYKAVIEIIRNLKNDRLFYQEIYQGKRLLSYQLLNRTEGEVAIYHVEVNHPLLFAEDEKIHESRILI